MSKGTRGRIFVKIGDYGTPEPIITSMKDEFMAKQCFEMFHKQMRDKAQFKDSDEVLVAHHEAGEDQETFFGGELEQALKWCREEN